MMESHMTTISFNKGPRKANNTSRLGLFFFEISDSWCKEKNGFSMDNEISFTDNFEEKNSLKKTYFILN